MTSTLRQFMIISIVGMTLALLALVYFHLDLSKVYLREHLDSHNRNLSIVLRNSLLATGLEKALVDGGPLLPDDAIAMIEATLEQELRWVPIVKVKIYSRDAIVLFSTNEREIGADASHNQGVQSALRGVPLSGQVHPNHMNEFDLIIELDNLHQQYIPIRAPGSDEVIGVFETYLNVHAVARSVERHQRIAFWSIGALLAVFIVASTTVFMRTHRLLQRESLQRRAHLRALQQMQTELEERVEQRTAELARAKQFLQSVIDGIADPLLVIRPDYTVALMNRKARSLKPEGQSTRFCYQISHRLDHPCDAPDHPCSFAEVMQRGCPAQVRHTHYDEAGNVIILDLQTTPLYGEDGTFEGVIEVEHDVTRIVEMQSGLIESEARLQAMMDNVPDAILTCDSDCRIESNNRSARALFGIGAGALTGRRLEEMIASPVDLAGLKNDAAGRHQVVMRRTDDSQFPAELWIGPLDRNGEVTSYIVVVRDVTSWLRAQRELDASREQYFHQDKMAAIGQLAAGILHEVGNPIAAIAGAAAEIEQTLIETNRGNGLRKNVELIDQQITRLGKITREIADFASPRPRERELLDLNGLLRSTARLLTYDRRFSSIGVTLDLDRKLPAIVGVADQLTQVFMNLLINAMDACVARGESKNCVSLSSRALDRGVEVRVCDRGIGMSRETLEHVLELFYTTKPVGKGSGLGLSLCDTIVRAHGGALLIESEEGEGTRVTVELPLDLEPADEADTASVAEVETGR